jgi:hypothetical protein
MAARYMRSQRARVAAMAGAVLIGAVVVSTVALAINGRSGGGVAVASASASTSASGTASDNASQSASDIPSELALGATATAAATPKVSAPATGTHLPPFPTQTAGTTPVATPPPQTVTIVAAGDIACDPGQNVGAPQDCDQAATAAQIGQLRPTAVLPLGDTQYENGTAAGYQKVYGPTWGQYKSISFPAIGNHEYLTSKAAGYFGYFNVPAYYSYDLGDWHMVSLDSECSQIGGCGAKSRQELWLLADLAAHPSLCTLVYWHEPRWSSGEHGDASQMTQIWSDLVAANVDVVLTGHNHDYERFVPLNGTGKPDPLGTTEFVVGTGGKNHYGFTTAPLTGEVVRNDTSFGVIDMALGPTGYSWKFDPAPGYTFNDSGSAACH